MKGVFVIFLFKGRNLLTDKGGRGKKEFSKFLPCFQSSVVVFLPSKSVRELFETFFDILFSSE